MFWRNLGFLIPTILLVSVGGLLLVLGWRTDPTVMTDDGMLPLRTLYLGLGGGFVGGILALDLLILLFVRRSQRRAEKLLATGLRGWATVLELEDTGIFVNEQPQVRIKLEIHLDDQPPYVLEKKMVLPHTRLAQVQVGSQVQVVVDPTDRTNPKQVGLLLK